MADKTGRKGSIIMGDERQRQESIAMLTNNTTGE